MPTPTTELTAAFASWDWLVIAVYFLFTTLLGARLAGKQATIRDFFLAGRKLPWWAICGSIIATEISAVTFIGVPTYTFMEGGNFAYLQLAIGAILARVIIGCYFVPRYYQREIYSPYDYMGARLGPAVKQSTTALFFVGAVLGQGARVYVAAIILRVLTGCDLTTSIWLIGGFSVCWALLGGMTTVIWTDVIQFAVMVLGAVVTLWFAVRVVPGGWTEVVGAGAATQRFDLFDLRTDLDLPYTLWCGLLATPFLNLAALGTDQVMAQRMFCCRNERDARLAIIVSSMGIGVAVLMLFVGVALYSYFRHQPCTPEEALLLKNQKDSLVPIFIVRALPAGVRGIVVAAVFASAISTLGSALAALAQATVGMLPRPEGRQKRVAGRLRSWLASDVGLSRALLIVWGVVLCLMATLCILIAQQYANVVELALALVGYTYGPLLGVFLLAFFPLNRDASGLPWAIPMAMLAVFGVTQHEVYWDLPGVLPVVDVSDWIVWLGAGAFLVNVPFRLRGRLSATAAVVVGALGVVLLHHYQVGVNAAGKPTYLAFTWSFPIGAIITFVIGYCLGKTRRAS